jgi:chromosome segregation ATPase
MEAEYEQKFAGMDLLSGEYLKRIDDLARQMSAATEQNHNLRKEIEEIKMKTCPLDELKLIEDKLVGIRTELGERDARIEQLQAEIRQLEKDKVDLVINMNSSKKKQEVVNYLSWLVLI